MINLCKKSGALLTNTVERSKKVPCTFRERSNDSKLKTLRQIFPLKFRVIALILDMFSGLLIKAMNLGSLIPDVLICFKMKLVSQLISKSDSDFFHVFHNLRFTQNC